MVWEAERDGVVAEMDESGASSMPGLVGRAMEMPLEEPAVLVDVFSEVGWKHNDTAALHARRFYRRLHVHERFP